MRTWVYNPHVGGVKIPPAVRLRTEQRVRAYAEAHYGGKFNRLDIRFRGVLCYIDAYIEPRQTVPLHLCRLRYFGNEKAWTMAFYTYSGKKYEPCVFGNGTFHGTPEEAFEIGADLSQRLVVLGRHQPRSGYEVVPHDRTAEE